MGTGSRQERAASLVGALLVLLWPGLEARGDDWRRLESAMIVGVAIDAVHVQVEEGWQPEGEAQWLSRPLPEGALLIGAEVKRCGQAVGLSFVEARRAVGPSPEAAGGLRFPVLPCEDPEPLAITWSYAVQADFEGGAYTIDLPGAEGITLSIAGGSELWGIRSATHRLSPRYPDPTRADVAVSEVAGQGAARFNLSWRLAGSDQPGLGALGWEGEGGEAGCALGLSPATAAHGEEDLLLMVLLDRRLGPSAVARIEDWYRRILQGLAGQDRVLVGLYDGAAPARRPYIVKGPPFVAAEALGLAPARALDLGGWVGSAVARAKGLSLANAVLTALAETTPRRWRRLIIAFGGQGRVDTAAIKALAAATGQGRVLLVTSDETTALGPEVAVVPWDSPWDTEGAGWPAAVARPQVGRVELGGGASGGKGLLGDLWGDRPLTVWTEGACPGSFDVDGEVGTSWLVRAVPVRPLEAHTPPWQAARWATLRRWLAGQPDPRSASVRRRQRVLGLEGGAWQGAWPGEGRRAKARLARIPPEVEAGAEVSLFGAAEGPRERAAGKRSFRIRTVEALRGGRSGTQLRDRLERHRVPIEAALGQGIAALPKGARRPRRLALSLRVDRAGSVTHASVTDAARGGGGTLDGAMAELVQILMRLALDPLDPAASVGKEALTHFTVIMDIQ